MRLSAMLISSNPVHGIHGIQQNDVIVFTKNSVFIHPHGGLYWLVRNQSKDELSKLL